MSLYKVSTQRGQQLYVTALSYKDVAECIEQYAKGYTVSTIELVSDSVLISPKVIADLHSERPIP